MSNLISPRVKQLWIYAMHVLHNFFGFNTNTTAFCLGRSSLHLLLLKSSMSDVKGIPSYETERNIWIKEKRVWKQKDSTKNWKRLFWWLCLVKFALEWYFYGKLCSKTVILVVSVKWDFLDFLQKYIFVLLITGFISIHLSTEKIAFAWDRNRVVLIITTVEAYA